MTLGKFFGYTCFSLGVIFWLSAYISIIWRGVKDRSYGMPLVALCLNISWEFIYSFIYTPVPVIARYAVRAWLLLDIPIAIQCLVYSRNEFRNRLTKKCAHLIFFATLAICFVAVLLFVEKFGDFRAYYSSFTSNLVMSACFIFMLVRRGDIRAQSTYIAIFKGLGTLFVFLWAYFWFPVVTDTVLTEIIPAQTQPLSKAIIAMYSIIVILDLIYIVLIYRKCIEKGKDPWRRF